MDKKQSVPEYLEILGCPVRDRVTGLTGIATSVGFDLYGCVQVIITPEIDKEGKARDSFWYDYHRIEITSKKRVMELPHFIEDTQRAKAMTGPNNKSVKRAP